MHELRDYQQQAVTQVAQKLASDKRKVIFQLATGGGKTVTFSAICNRYTQKSGKSVLILVHRKELLQQTRRTLYDWYGINAISIQAGMKTIPHAPVYVGMVESVNKRVDKLPEIGLLIIDECHLGNFKKLHQHFTDSYIVGFSATPLSASKKDPLKNHYEDIVCSVDIPDLITAGSLAPCKTWTIKNNIDRKSLSSRMGEFVESEQASIFKRGKQVQNTIEAYNKFAAGTKTIIFNVNIEHSTIVNAAFVEAGLPSRHLDAGSTPEYRAECLRWLRDTPDAILNNVGILTTGFDEPSVQSIIVNKATMSMPLWLQMTGRGARPYAGKDYFTIIDLGGNAHTHGDWCDPRNWTDLFNNPPQPSKDGVAPVKDCPKCMRLVSVRTTECPECGYQWPEPENKNTYDTLPAEFVLITRNLNVPEMIERNSHLKEYATFFKIGTNIATQAKYKLSGMSDNIAASLLVEYHNKVKEWCEVKEKKFNKWHKEKSAEHLYTQLKSNFPQWQTQL